MKRLKPILYMTLIAMMAFFTTCGEVPEEPGSIIFPGLKRIELGGYDGVNFTYTAPDDVKYLVLGIFKTDIETDPNTMTLITTMVGGSRTGLGMTRSSVNNADIFDYDYATGNFLGTTYNPVADDHWAVWGYDEYGNLTHASEDKLIP